MSLRIYSHPWIPVPSNEGHFISHNSMICKKVFQNLRYEIHSHGCYLPLQTNSLYMKISHMCTRFSGWLNGINRMLFMSLTPAEKLTAFFRPQSNLQYRKLNWRDTYVWGSCWLMSSTENPCLQRNNVSKQHSRSFLGKKKELHLGKRPSGG